MKKLSCIPFIFRNQVSRSIPQTVPILYRNITLSFKILGEGTLHPHKPPIFIFHGLLGSRKDWDAVGKTIVNITHRTVVTVDLRNHGHSSHANSHTFTDQANDVIKLLEKLGAKQVSLIGHSMGGRTAMCVALMAPQKVAGLLVIDISPKSISAEYSKAFLKILSAMQNTKLQKYTKLSVAKTEIRKQMKQITTDENILEAVISNLRRQSNGELGWACNLDVLLKDYKYWISFPENLKHKVYDGPTLFIGGQLSEYIQPDDLTSIRDLFPRAVVIYIPNTNHYVHIDDPKTFLELTISFIRTHSYSNEHLGN